MRTKPMETRQVPPAVDADTQAAEAFIRQINRKFRALGRSLNLEKKLTLLLVAGELNSEGFISDILLSAKPTCEQGKASWGMIGLAG